MNKVETTGFQYIQIVIKGGAETLKECLARTGGYEINPKDLRAEICIKDCSLLLADKELKRLAHDLETLSEFYLSEDNALQYLAVHAQDIAQVKQARDALKSAHLLLQDRQARLGVIWEDSIPIGPLM